MSTILPVGNGFAATTLAMTGLTGVGPSSFGITYTPIGENFDPPVIADQRNLVPSFFRPYGLNAPLFSDNSLSKWVPLTQGQTRALSTIMTYGPQVPEDIFLIMGSCKDPNDVTTLIEARFLEKAGFINIKGTLSRDRVGKRIVGSQKKRSITLVVPSVTGNIERLIRNNPRLLDRKIKHIVINGDVDYRPPLILKKAQKLGIPLTIVSMETLKKTALPRSFFNDIAGTNHPLGKYVGGGSPLMLLTAIPAVRKLLFEPRTLNHRGQDLVFYVGDAEIKTHQLLHNLVAALGKVSLRGRPSVIFDHSYHTDAFKLHPEGYPQRFRVPIHKIPWSEHFAGYEPNYYVADIVIENDRTTNEGGFAHPEDISLVDLSKRRRYVGEISFDDRGRPINPMGRTGIEGRGWMGKWGPNFAVDSIVTRINPETKKLEMIVIERSDFRKMAIPGGMVDAGESVLKALTRELQEETNVDMTMDGAIPIFSGYHDDPKNTDNAWIETFVAHRHLDDETGLKTKPLGGDDALSAQWLELSRSLVHNLYSSHGRYVTIALIQFYETHSEEISTDARKQIEEIIRVQE